MYKSEIGTNAGKIWRILKETREITLQDLAGKVGLSVEDTALAVGWLARENKHLHSEKGLYILGIGRRRRHHVQIRINTRPAFKLKTPMP